MESFNDELLDQSKQLSLQEYHARIIPKLFPDINISKSDFIIELSTLEDDNFCIHQDKLTKFEIISFTDIDSLKSILIKSNLIENKHFKIKISVKEESFILLNPLGFRTFLLNVQDTDFINHLLMINKIHSNYYDYQIKYRERYIESDEVRIKKTDFEDFRDKLSIACNSTEIIRGLIFDRLYSEAPKKNDTSKINVNHIQYKILQHKNDEKKLILTTTKRKTQGDYKKLIIQFACQKDNLDDLLQTSIEEFNQDRLIELMDGIDLEDDNMTEEELKEIQEMMDIIETDHNIKCENKNEYILGKECMLEEFIELIEKIK